MTNSSDDESSNPPKSVFSRSRELFSLAARIGQKELSHRLSQYVSTKPSLSRLQSQLEQARILVESLGRLKGAAMKVGQLFSLEARDFLPTEVVDVLSKLQDQSPPLDSAEIEKIILKEYPPELRQELKNFSPKPIAAASIGQVHRVEFQGESLALKIQYPGISESIDSDLSILRKLFQSFLKLGKRDINIDPLLDELTEVLKREVDYIHEAQSLRSYAQFLASSPEYCVPKTYPELCTSKILAMSYESGLSLAEWIKSQPSRDEREHLGHLVLQLYIKEFFDAGFVQTDPNFGNFLYRPSTRQLVLLDLGATRKYSEEFRKNYSQLLKIIREGSHSEIVEHSTKMDLIKKEESPETLNLFVGMLKISTQPFDPDKQPFEFGNLDYSRTVRAATSEFIKTVRFSPPPHQLIFLHRKLGGIFALLKTLDVRLDLQPYWKQLVP